MMPTPYVFLMFTFPSSATLFSLSALTEDRKVLQHKSSVFFSFHTFKDGTQKDNSSKYMSAFLARNFTPCCGYSVKTALKCSVTKDESYQPLDSISSEDIKSSLGCYPQNVSANPRNCNIVTMMHWR